MASGTKSGKLNVLQLSEDGGTTWLTIVCAENDDYSLDATTTTINTKCNDNEITTKTGFTEVFSGDGVVPTTVGATEADFSQLYAWAKNKTLVLDYRYGDVIGETPGNTYLTGTGQLNSLGQTNPSADIQRFSYSFTAFSSTEATFA